MNPRVRQKVTITEGYQVRRNSDGTLKRSPYVVRWRVDGKQGSRSFATKGEANAWRSQLVAAKTELEPFDPHTLLPKSWARQGITVADFAHTWFGRNWDTLLPRSRKSMAEALARFLVNATTDRVRNGSSGPIGHFPKHPVHRKGTRLPEKTLEEMSRYREVRLWLCADRTSRGPKAIPRPTWLENSLLLGDIDKPTCALLAEAMFTKLDGTKCKKNTRLRYTNVIRPMLESAVEDELISINPWPTRRSKSIKTRTKEKITKKVPYRNDLPTPTQMASLIEAIPSRAIRCAAALMYYGGLRPSEAAAAKVSSLTLGVLPEDWGTIIVDRAVTDAGADYGDEDEIYGVPKPGQSRSVPIPPEGMAVLRANWVAETDGLLAPGTNGWHLRHDELVDAFRTASSGRWAPYDARHAAATLWLEAGVPIGVISNRLGHSPEVLLNTYVGTLSGNETLSNERIRAALISGGNRTD